MAHPLRFQALILPNTSWPELKRRFQLVESLGFDLGVTGDHFVDWSNPPSPWFDLWSTLAGVAEATTTLRLAPCVGQIPLRSPAMFAREALSVEHISNGRLEMGLGLGLPMDPSYDMMGIPNWSNKERAARFPEYVEIVDRLLTDEITTYEGKYYQVRGAHMNPRPIQKPRPPMTIAALGPLMIKYAARYGDTWNTMSFGADFDTQMIEAKERVATMATACAGEGRDVNSLRHSYNMFDPSSRHSGGRIAYYESSQVFTQMVERIVGLGFSEIGVYYPMVEDQMASFEAIARETIPALRAKFDA